MVGGGYGFFDTTLEFDDRAVATRQHSLAVSGARRLGEATSVRLSAGAILGGFLEHEGRRFDVGAGWLATLGASHRLSRERWFLTGTFSFGASFTDTEERGGGPRSDLSALDARLGMLAGVTLAELVSPYLLARGFGGPVFWTLDGEEITGSDRYHYQLGAGASASLPGGVSAQIDASALGERSLSLAAAVAF